MPGETVLVRCEAQATRRFLALWDGTLFVTDRRLFWRRHRLSPPFPRTAFVDLPLSDIESAKSASLFGAFGVLYIETLSNGRYSFMPYHWTHALWIWVSGKLARRLAHAINKYK